MLTLSNSLDCCICGKGVQATFYKKIDSYELLRCHCCGLIRLSQVEIPPENFLNDASEKNDGKIEYWGFPEYFKKYAEIFNHFFQDRFRKIKSYQSIEGEWLDVGSGYGLWQKFLERNNQRSIGIEIEKEAYLFAKNDRVDIELVSIEKYQTNKKFAVITMCDVLEHVEDPLAVLEKCKALLLNDGLLYIQVPNVIGLKYPFGDTLGLPHHLWQFDPKTLQSLTRRAGFETVEVWTGIQGVIRYYEQGGPSILRRLLWKLASITRRGNRLQLLVRK